MSMNMLFSTVSIHLYGFVVKYVHMVHTQQLHLSQSVCISETIQNKAYSLQIEVLYHNVPYS